MPSYTLDTIKYSTDSATFERAVGLYDAKKVQYVKATPFGFDATVIGTKPYRVSVDNKDITRADCTCYMGQNDILCKHVIALALHVVLDGKPLKQDDKKFETDMICSGRRGELSAEELKNTKQQITEALHYIKPYNGPSKIWFQYQGSLSEGCARLVPIVNELPVSLQTAKLLVDVLLRLERKIMNGVDDSDGTVGDCMMGIVGILEEFARIESACIKAFKKIIGRDESFGWGASLVALYENTQ